MLNTKSFTTCAIALIVAMSVAIWSMTATDASAQGMHQHGMHSAGQHSGQQPSTTTARAAAHQTPHGGQFSVAGPLRFEVVYLPQEIRVYLYDASNRPLSAKGATGQVSLKVRGNEKEYRYPLAHIATLPGSDSQDYLAAAVNISRIKDGDMTVGLSLTNLPSRDLPAARITQSFAHSQLPVRVAALTEADRPGIARQKVCAVMGGQLGSMGTPVKVLLGDQPIYLCCKGCLGKVQANPAAYLPKSIPAKPAQAAYTCSMHPQIKATAPGKCPICGMSLIAVGQKSGAHAGHAAAAGHNAATDNRLTVSTSTAADRAAIAQQRVCAVSGSRLGGMGTPVKVTMNGQSLFLCCKGCLAKVKKDPATYFAKAAQLRGQR